MFIGYRGICDFIFKSSCVMPNEQFEKIIHDLEPIGVTIEIGTFRGLSTAVIASVSEKVYTFDVKYEPIAKLIWETMPINNKIEYNIIKDVSEIKDIVGNIKCDFAFIDALHTKYEFLKQTFIMLKEMGIKRMLFDGVMPRFPASEKFANELNMKVFHNRYGYWEAK